MIKVSIVLIAKFIDQKDFVLNVVAIARKEGEFKVISLLMAPGLHTMRLSEAAHIEGRHSENHRMSPFYIIGTSISLPIANNITNKGKKP